ncbi:hypothetical protein SZ25_00394 [Candidatus Arcanobacter lacustris]|uniref:Heme/hemopexin transporter protein HuxB n=1 Tax=Candidatus Arcanibacter lacustris TaxID=1607817 RepID=A0A0F5MR22_9RICK|nr:hypothetical protein SZ25_00394 [Candidatus Arcanobacter lacustris]
MKYIMKYTLLIIFIINFAYAEVVARAINNSKDYYHKNKLNLDKNKVEQIATSKVYTKDTTRKNYFIKKILINVEGVDFTGNIDFLYRQYIGQNLDNEKILYLSRHITRYFINQNYLLPQINIDEQDLLEGILNIKVLISTLDDVVIIGDNNQLVREYASKILNVRPTTVDNTQKYLALMNKIPGYKVLYKIRRELKANNAERSPIDLVLVTKKLKGEVFSSIDNYGVNNLGKEQFIAEAQLYSMFNDGDALTFTGFTTNHPDRIHDIGLGYKIPVNYRGTYVHLAIAGALDNPSKNSTFRTKDNKQTDISFALTHPLYLTTLNDLKIKIGANIKTISNYSLNSSAKNNSARYWSGNLGLTYLTKDKLDGYNIIKIDLIQGIGGKFKDYIQQNNLVSQHFNLLKLNIYREQPLINNFSVFSHLSSNSSNKTIPDHELFVVGGHVFGRAYQFDIMNGSNMLGFTLETRYKKKLNHKLLEEIQPYVFFDTGSIAKQKSNINKSNLSSYGAGIRFELPYKVNFTTEIALPLTRHYIINGNYKKLGARFNLFANKLFEF